MAASAAGVRQRTRWHVTGPADRGPFSDEALGHEGADTKMTFNPDRHASGFLKLLVVMSLVGAACTLQAPSPQEQAATATPFIFPTATEATASPGSISGLVWHDLCDPGGEGEPTPTTAPDGCVEREAGGFEADGILAEGEPGIAGLIVQLGEGSCPAFGLEAAVTTEEGTYRFDDIEPGSYCVSVDSAGEENSSVLIPGGWTSPTADDSTPVAQQQVEVEAGASLEDINFGWDYQFLPDPTETPMPTATSTSTPTSSATATATATATPSRTPTTSPQATATQGSDDPKEGLGDPIFEDDLDTAANWDLYSNDQVEFTLGDGRIDMVALEADFEDWWTLAGPTVEDFYVEGLLGIGECAGRDEVGLVVRSTNVEGNWVGYLFAVTCDGRYALRIWDGESMTKIVTETRSNLITAGSNQEHRLGVMAEGDRLTLYVNGNRLRQVTDSTYDSGLVGVFIGAANTPGLTGYLDLIQLWELP